jgi:hypothetical protein
MPQDEDVLMRARELAAELLATDPELEAPEHALLADAMRARYGAEELEPLPA